MGNIPNIFGLVLAGGKSSRMGSDKGRLRYHGTDQREHVYRLLAEFCGKVYLSVRKDQLEQAPKGLECVVDRDLHRGPFNGILSAHAQHPQVAWLVLACDLPLMDGASLQCLLDHRRAEKWATSLASRESGLPEPMATLWEPKGLQAALDHLKTAESSCPRKFLMGSDIALVWPERDEVLFNANSREDYHFVKNRLAHGS